MKNARAVLFLVCLGSWLVWPASPALAESHAAEQRCGWLENPTPANWWLRDRDGEWVLSVQGGYQADGLANLPDIAGKQWVVTNSGGYGYGCACLDVQVDKKSRQVVRLMSARPLSLGRCKADRKLPAPDE